MRLNKSEEPTCVPIADPRDTMTDPKAGKSGVAPGFYGADYVKIVIFGIALSALWTNLNSIIIPVQLLSFVPQSLKNTYLGLLTLAGLIVAIVVQPIAGALSDRSTLKWGRRRPYILAGAIAAVPFVIGLGFATSAVTFIASYCMLQACCNVAQGAYQGFIPDLVPQARRGLASGVKALFEAIGAIALVLPIGYFMDRYSNGAQKSWLWLSLGLLIFLLLCGASTTSLVIRESPSSKISRPSILSTLRKVFNIDLKKRHQFITFLLSRGFMVIPAAMLQTFALYYLTDKLGVSGPTAVANLVIVVGISSLIAVFPAGYLSDKVGRKPVVVSAGFLGASAIIWLLLSRNYTQILIGGGVIGIANGAFIAGSWALATDLVTKGEEARGMGLVNLASAGGSALARLVGPIIDLFNRYQRNLGYSVMLLLALGCYLAGSILLLVERTTSSELG